MKNRVLLSIVVTSFNDRAIIEPHFQALCMTLENQDHYDWEIIFVDDGSADDSIEVLRKITSQHHAVTAIELARNFGQQKAFFVGIKFASGDVVITLDGDYQYDTNCLITLADKVREGYDLVSGVRVRRRDPWLSRITSYIGQCFVRRALRYPVQDFGSVKAYSRFLINEIVKFENYCVMPHGMAFALTRRIAEIPVIHRARLSGNSKWTFTKRLHMYLDLFLAYSPYEATNLIRIGICSTFIGLLVLFTLLYLYFVHGIFFFHSFTAVLALCLIGGGGALIISSLFLSFFLRIYRQILWKGECCVLREFYGDRPILKQTSSQIN